MRVKHEIPSTFHSFDTVLALSRKAAIYKITRFTHLLYLIYLCFNVWLDLLRTTNKLSKKKKKKNHSSSQKAGSWTSAHSDTNMSLPFPVPERKHSKCGHGGSWGGGVLHLSEVQQEHSQTAHYTQTCFTSDISGCVSCKAIQLCKFYMPEWSHHQ